MIISPQILVFACLASAAGRKIQNTGGSIALEEAWSIPELVSPSSNTGGGGLSDAVRSNLLDIHNQRLQGMDQNHVDYMVISCAEPCIQGIPDPIQAQNMSVHVNNMLAATISNNTERFGGFASLAMQNATAAALELERTVKEFGFLGAMLNDYQQSGSDGQTLLYYDQPEYDVFWQKVSDLDVPVYFHPRTSIDIITKLMFAHAPVLEGAVQEFAAILSTHILGCVLLSTEKLVQLNETSAAWYTDYASMGSSKGLRYIISRFPKLKIIVGHLGERIPSDLNRIDTRLIRQGGNANMEQNVTTYFHTNIFETTAGNFATDLLHFHIGQIGLDRIMFSIDYPFVQIPEATSWIQGLETSMNKQDFNSLQRGLAEKVLGLNK
ncbi:hypothetical protein CPC08DRAFT_779565 [Agrocybe pediades]|nr:hypothetical protein CPC08DRAFT_779565 [Agrocybe pediades]